MSAAPLDPLALLERPNEDKWFLGGGRTLIYAPPFPQHLQTPGLWDEAYLLDFAHPRPFTWALLDENDHEIPLRWESHSWRPDRMTRVWFTSQGLRVEERSCCLHDDVLAADIIITNETNGARELNLAVWTVQTHTGAEGDERIVKAFGFDTGVGFTREIHPVRRGETLPPVRYRVSLAASGRYLHNYGAVLSQANASDPQWRFTPFADGMQNGVFARQTYGSRFPQEGNGALYIGGTFDATVRANATLVVTVTCAFEANPERELHHLSPFFRSGTAGDIATAEWRAWFAGVPQFECSDALLTRAYWYRWYGLRLNAIEPPAEGPWTYRHPAVCEGIAYFRNLISYSAHAHMRDLRWMHDPTFAHGSLRNFLDNQKADGSFPGNLYATFRHDSDMYHADWGRALLATDELHPDPAFLTAAYAPLTRHARFYLDARDSAGSHLFDVVNQWETGQEYMHRYTAVDKHADGGGELQPHLKGVDATLYAYHLFVALHEIATQMGREDEAREWAAHATATEQAMLTVMWDAKAGMFSDVNAATMARTNVRAAVCFYPFISLGLGSDDFLRALREHLLNPAEFWTPYPVPAESASDPEFSAEPIWRGERKNCPWNGRVWPMTNSHVLEALAVIAQAFAPDLASAAAHMLRQFCAMMTVSGDPARPNTYEHYHPYTGTASYYRGIDDYMHSYLIDLIIRFVAGLQPQPDGSLVVYPLPLDLDAFTLTDTPYRGRRIGIQWQTDTGLTVSLDGQAVAFSATLAPLALLLSEGS